MSNSRTGQYDNAVDAFKRAAVSAERSGDTVSNANALLNLASLASDLGRFAKAAGYFRAAIDLDTGISTSRVTTAIYCNAANLSLALGNHREADMFLLAATTAAEQSQLWQHFVNVRLTGADLHLAKGEVDAAWTLVKEALMLTAERHRLVPDLGQYWRLRIHYFTTTGDDGARPSETPKLATVAHSLELKAFQECLKNDHQRHCGDTPAQQQLIQHGLFGVLARLAAVGVSYGQIPSATEEISGARAVADAFPDEQWDVIPAGVLHVR